LGPVLLFAPRRAHAEELASDIARQLPCPHPLQLTEAQKRLVGEPLAKMLKSRVAYHHSGLSYAVRAGVIEPLTKAGQLRVVVATMGLAAGINFSLRSVAITAAQYKREGREIPLRGDEILQMFGRAGRRGLDEMGYVLVSANELRMRDGHPCALARSGMVDWSALLGLMAVAADAGKSPFVEAVRVQERLFTTKPIILGVEESLKRPNAPCGWMTDAERARQVRKKNRELLNSAGEWEPYPFWQERPLGKIWVITATTATTALPIPSENGSETAVTPSVPLKSALTVQEALEKVGQGGLTALEETPEGTLYGRSMIVADRMTDGRLILAKWVRRLTQWHGREVSHDVFIENLKPALEKHLLQQRLPVVRWVEHEQAVTVLVSLELQTIKVPVDRHGVALWRPKEREVLSAVCARCEWTEVCRGLSAAPGTAITWRRLGLVDAQGNPTRRGRVVSFFSGGDGLAIAAALEDTTYPLEELVYDLANLDAGFRFCADGDRYGGQLAFACRKAYGPASIDGYLETGLPLKYGTGAETVVRRIHEDPACKVRFVSEVLGTGDIDRMIIEWRSLLRQIAHAAPLEWPRWTELQAMAKPLLHEVHSPTETILPPLEYAQTKRIDHRLILRRS
jgi:hypothetical protein